MYLKPFYIKLFSIGLIFCLGIIVYSDALHCSFHLDDRMYVLNNSAIKNIHHLQNIWNIWPSRFITNFSLAFNYHFNGLNVSGYHLFNLGVHLLSAILVWWLTLLTFSTPAMKEAFADGETGNIANIVALFAGLVFVAHPIQTEAVTYIVQRAASMATLFYLASLCLYIKSRLSKDKGPSPDLARFYYFGSVITAVLAMFSKEMAITLPLMILLYEYSFLKTKEGLNWKYLLPFLFILFIIPLTTIYTDPAALNLLRGDPGISSMHYLLTQFRVMVTYIRLVFLPLNQNLDYDYPVFKSVFDAPVLVSLIFLITVLFCAKRLFSKYKLVSFAIYWFFLTLLPESSFFPIRDVIYEHRLYLPLVGFSIFLVSSAYYLIGKHNITYMALILIAMIVFYSVLTYQRNKVWRDDLTLWDDTVGKSPHKARPYLNRGMNYYEQGEYTKAMTDFNKAIENNPKDANAYYDRGLIYDYQGKFIKALSDYNKSIELEPYDNPTVYENRSVLYINLGTYTKSIFDLNKAIELQPNNAGLYIKRAYIYYKQDEFTQALSDLNKAIEIDPDGKDAYTSRFEIYNVLAHKLGNS
jgi:protein O-mannosyl-transferase